MSEMPDFRKKWEEEWKRVFGDTAKATADKVAEELKQMIEADIQKFGAPKEPDDFDRAQKYIEEVVTGVLSYYRNATENLFKIVPPSAELKIEAAKKKKFTKADIKAYLDSLPAGGIYTPREIFDGFRVTYNLELPERAVGIIGRVMKNNHTAFGWSSEQIKDQTVYTKPYLKEEAEKTARKHSVRIEKLIEKVLKRAKRGPFRIRDITKGSDAKSLGNILGIEYKQYGLTREMNSGLWVYSQEGKPNKQKVNEKYVSKIALERAQQGPFTVSDVAKGTEAKTFATVLNTVYERYDLVRKKDPATGNWLYSLPIHKKASLTKEIFAAADDLSKLPKYADGIKPIDIVDALGKPELYKTIAMIMANTAEKRGYQKIEIPGTRGRKSFIYKKPDATTSNNPDSYRGEIGPDCIVHPKMAPEERRTLNSDYQDTLGRR